MGDIRDTQSGLDLGWSRNNSQVGLKEQFGGGEFLHISLDTGSTSRLCEMG